MRKNLSLSGKAWYNHGTSALHNYATVLALLTLSVLPSGTALAGQPIIINEGTHSGVYGNGTQPDGYLDIFSPPDTANGYSVIVNGGTVNDLVCGGYAESNGGSATTTGNSVTINGGTVNGHGGYARHWLNILK